MVVQGTEKEALMNKAVEIKDKLTKRLLLYILLQSNTTGYLNYVCDLHHSSKDRIVTLYIIAELYRSSLSLFMLMYYEGVN